MINGLKNDEYININLFGKEKSVRVFCTGDNCFDEFGNDKDDGFELSQEELDVLNWFLENVKIEDYKQQILDYCSLLASLLYVEKVLARYPSVLNGLVPAL